MSTTTKSGLDAAKAMFNIEADDADKINPYMVESDPKLNDQFSEYQESRKDLINSLRNRFVEPNWLAVSAQFAKPQLGGFGASWGSAMGELGAQEENRRAMLPTIAKMRAENSRNFLMLGQKAKAAGLAEDAAKKGIVAPGAAGDIAGLTSGPGSVAKAITEQEGAAIQQIAQMLQSGKSIVELRNTLGDEFVDKYLPMALDRFSGLRNIAGVQNTKPPAPVVDAGGGAPAGGAGNAEAIAANQQKIATLQAKIDKYGIGPEDKAELARLNQERAALGINTPAPAASTPSVTPPVAQPQAQSGNYYPPSYTPPTSMPHGQSLEISKANAQKQIDEANAPAIKKFAVASMFDPQGTSYMQATAATEGALQGIYSNPAAFSRVTNLVNKAGGLAAIVNAGVGVHLGPYGAKIDIPVSKYKEANLSPEDQEFANILANKVATNAYYGLLARGINPENQGADKFNTLLLQETHLGQTARAIEHSLKMNKSYFDHQAEAFNIVNREMASGKANPNSPTKLADIYNNSPELIALQRRQAAIHRALNKEAFTPAAPPKP